MKKINEIFYSLQGEGAHCGVPSVFVRFSGCNLSCPFCDTKHQEGNLMTDDEIIDQVSKYPAPWVILTGGEPSLYIDAQFVSRLKEETGKLIAIETNGTRRLPIELDWITVSPKTGICSKSEEDGNAAVVVTHADEIKVVDVGQPLDPYFELPCHKDDTMMYLQPCYVSDEKELEANRQRTINRVMTDPRWNLSIQLHRFLGIP